MQKKAVLGKMSVDPPRVLDSKGEKSYQSRKTFYNVLILKDVLCERLDQLHEHEPEMFCTKSKKISTFQFSVRNNF